MAYNIISSPETEDDIDKAVEYYVTIDKTLAKQFLAELKAVKIYIANNPEKIQIRYKKIRVAFLKKFPYGIHFVVKKKQIFIVAVFNTYDNPAKWNDR